MYFVRNNLMYDNPNKTKGRWIKACKSVKYKQDRKKGYNIQNEI